MAIIDAKQFDGTLGSAKAACAWVGDPAKAVYGATLNYTDEQEGGLNLVGTDDAGAPAYTTVNPTEWVAKTDDGQLLVFTDAQLRVVFPQAFTP